MTSEPVDTTEQQEATPRVGEQLKSARIAQGKELQAVAEALHLDLATILALEADDQHHLPAAIFVQGYIQNYARLLGLPAEPLLTLYKQHAPNTPELVVGGSKERPKPVIRMNEVMHFTPHRSAGRWLVRVFAVLLVLLLAGVVWWLWPQLFSASVESEAETTVVFAPIGGSPATIRTTVTETAEVMITPDVVMPDEPPEVVEEPAVSAPSIVPEPPPLAVQSLDRLIISSEQESWIEVVDAEQQRVIYRLFLTGHSHQAEGKAPFKVLLGYAPGVELSINGQLFDITPYIMSDNSARFSAE
ncbi:MAG: DUF4115 domain-containing protein [Gammaproteobacteria bacterium]|nr:DUF4115 domain-containing protein [Gammaproteobacteria bacterium]MCF6230854.1 DUF4115 domain-containing protein [Gammaproteobacteria bacterium]